MDLSRLSETARQDKRCVCHTALEPGYQIADFHLRFQSSARASTWARTAGPTIIRMEANTTASLPLGWIATCQSSANQTLHCHLFGRSIPQCEASRRWTLVTNNKHPRCTATLAVPPLATCVFSWGHSQGGQAAGLERVRRDPTAQNVSSF